MGKSMYHKRKQKGIITEKRIEKLAEKMVHKDMERQRDVAIKLLRLGYKTGQDHMQKCVMKALGIGPKRWAMVEEYLKETIKNWEGEEVVEEVQKCLIENVL